MFKHSGIIVIPLKSDVTDSGFTLVELMVTLVIFSFVMVMLFSSFNAFTSTGQSIAQGVADNARARDVFRRVLDDLTNIYVPESRIRRVQNNTDDQNADPFQMAGSESPADGKTFSSVEFASLSGLQTGRIRPSGVVRITYYVRKNSQGLFDLCRAERPIGSDKDTDPCLDPVLAENITGFTIDFVDAQGNEHQTWDRDKDSDGAFMPYVLNIGLALKGKNKDKIFETAVVLPIQVQTGE